MPAQVGEEKAVKGASSPESGFREQRPQGGPPVISLLWEGADSFTRMARVARFPLSGDFFGCGTGNAWHQG